MSTRVSTKSSNLLRIEEDLRILRQQFPNLFDERGRVKPEIREQAMRQEQSPGPYNLPPNRPASPVRSSVRPASPQRSTVNRFSVPYGSYTIGVTEEGHRIMRTPDGREVIQTEYGGYPEYRARTQSDKARHDPHPKYPTNEWYYD